MGLILKQNIFGKNFSIVMPCLYWLVKIVMKKSIFCHTSEFYWKLTQDIGIEIKPILSMSTYSFTVDRAL